MSYFFDYIRNIILFLIFSSFIQIILSDTKYKSYVGLILNMIMLLIMIEPINNVIESIKNISITDQIEDISESTYYDNKSNEYEKIQNQMIEEAFKENIKTQIETKLNNKYYIENIDILLYENKYGETYIDNIDIHLIKNYSGDKTNEIENIKNIISNMYSIGTDNITISIS